MMDAVAELIERPVEHRLGGPSGQDWRREGLERAGYTFDRLYNRMIAPLSAAMPGPNLPADFTIRPFAGEGEIEEWVSVFNNGFGTHHDPPTTTVEEKRHRMGEAGYLPNADLVLVHGSDGMVGLARNSREIVDNGADLGWVNSIVILPAYRGQGLGRALLRASMRALFDSGFERAILTVDTGNETGALHLYESVGFRIDHQFIQHARVIDPAAAP
jgi:mycothiol synthase